jgi:hypothetical protein
MTPDGPIVQQRPSLGPSSLRPAGDNNAILEFMYQASQNPLGSVNHSKFSGSQSMTPDGPIVQQRPSLGPSSLRPTQDDNTILEFMYQASQIPPGSINQGEFLDSQSYGSQIVTLALNR